MDLDHSQLRFETILTKLQDIKAPKKSCIWYWMFTRSPWIRFLPVFQHLYTQHPKCCTMSACLYGTDNVGIGIPLSRLIAAGVLSSYTYILQALCNTINFRTTNNFILHNLFFLGSRDLNLWVFDQTLGVSEFLALLCAIFGAK